MKKIIQLLLLISMVLMPYANAFAVSNDSTPPSDVENLKVKSVNDGSVTLTWDLATDNEYVTNCHIYYGLQSVGGKDDANYTEVEETADVLEHAVTGLENGVKYYFAATALDAAGNESEYYSKEVSAVPEPSAVVASGDTEAPVVLKAEALYDTVVNVTFSEEIVFPENNPQSAFAIQNNHTLDYLEVLKAELGSDGKTVKLTTVIQETDTPYIVTVGIDIEDKVGNPIISGVSDVAMFYGYDKQKKPDPVDKDTEAPYVTGVEVLSDSEIKVTFNEPVDLGIDIVKNFEVSLESDPSGKLKITSIVITDNDYAVSITTEKQAKATYVLTVNGISDKAGNLIKTDEETNKGVFAGKGETTLLDLVAPENITNLMTKAMNGVVKLSWKASMNSEKDLTKLMLYRSKDKGKTYDNGTQISPDATSFDVYGLEPGIEYYFKVTGKDDAGNENSGAVSSAVLPATGPGLLLLAIASLGAGVLSKKRC